MMTDDRLAELDRLCEAANPGPWAWDEQRESHYPKVLNMWPPKPEILDGSGKLRPVFYIPTVLTAYGEGDEFWVEVEDGDARFIAAARTAVPELIAEVRRLRAELAEAERLLAMPTRCSP